MLGALTREPGIGRAEALRRAMVALLDDPPAPYLAHPAAWAPFVLVGEGGGGTGSVRTAAGR